MTLIYSYNIITFSAITILINMVPIVIFIINIMTVGFVFIDNIIIFNSYLLWFLNLLVWL